MIVALLCWTRNSLGKLPDSTMAGEVAIVSADVALLGELAKGARASSFVCRRFLKEVVWDGHLRRAIVVI